MLTAHQALGPTPFRYGKGWEILDDDLRVVAVVNTKRETIAIVKAQKLPSKEAR